MKCFACETDECGGTRLPSVRSDSLLAEAIALLRVADCPNCDGSGGVPRQVAEEQLELEQCQWCDELHSLFERYTANAPRQDRREATYPARGCSAGD